MTPIASVRGSSQALPADDGAAVSSSAGRKARVPRSASTTARPAEHAEVHRHRHAQRRHRYADRRRRRSSRCDQAAWNRGMIERPSPRSTSAPSTFIATSQMPVPMP